jgi:3-hydroxybutyryl-CoA dehydratase
MPEAALLSSTFEQLRKGDTFATGGRTVSEADFAWFAAQSESPHPAHSAGAASTPFGKRVAPGILTLSLALGLVRLDPEGVIALRGMTDVVFTRPVGVGDILSVTGRVSALTPLDDHTGLVTITLLTANQHRRTVCRARIQILWRRHLPALTDEEGD